VFAGRINPGEISIVRRIVTGDANPTDVDTAVYSGNLAEYTLSVNPNGTVTVNHNGGIDGVDTLRNVERLRFLDQTIPVPRNSPATGTILVSDATPTEDQLLTATVNTLVDPDGIDNATLVIQWEAETAPGTWTLVGTGASFAPGDAVVGLRLRAVASFQDNGTPPNSERVPSAPTAVVAAVNDPPVGAPVVSDLTPQVGAQLSAVTSGISDADGLGPFSYQWRANGANLVGQTGVSFTPTNANLGQTLSVVVSYVDRQGFSHALTSAATAAVNVANGPVVSVPGTFSFGNRRVNTSTVGQLTVRNVGSATLQVTSVSATGAGFVSATVGTCAAGIVPGATCRVGVTFLPTAVGSFSGTLRIDSNATNSPTFVSLTGNGQ
jgi:hypothetical protein